MVGRGGTRSGGGPVTAPDHDEPRSGPATALAEVGVLALAMGTAASFTRLFLGWSFLGRMAVPVVAAWALSVALRRLRVPVGTAALVSLAAGVVVLTLAFVPGGSWLGLPSPTTVTALGEELRASFADFRQLVAPVPATTGFLVVLSASMWLFGCFADAAVFRYRAPGQAAIPYAATFVATGVLARDAGRWSSAAWFGAGLVVYAATQRAREAAERRWVSGEQARGTRAVLGGAAVAASVALVAGLALGPLLPGGTEPVVDLRDLGRGGGSRTVVSPFVGVRSLLGERSDQVVFTVAADAAAYWRLTALEEYDAARDIWTSRRSYQRAEGSLSRQGPTPPSGGLLDQRYRIAGLGGLWLPAAHQAVELRTSEDVSWDPASASLISRDEALPAGAGYRVTSELPDLDRAALAGPSTGRGLDAVHLDRPDLHPVVLQAAQLATAGARSPYERALALQRYFREAFDYDETVDYRDDADPTAAFLAARRGFCQQFASTFALMARSLGLPSRVAVGFTPGDPVADVGSVGAGAGAAGGGPGFVVRGRHAHAWPEVWFDGVGWVPFEPTPGRGNPQASGYTGVAPQQAEPPPEQAATTTSATPTTTSTPGSPSSTAPPEGTVDAAAPGAAEEPVDGPGPSRSALVAAIVVVAAAVALAVRWSLRRRRRAADLADPRRGRAAAAWDLAVDRLAVLGVRPRPDETPWEFAGRASGAVGAAELDPPLEVLARVETARRFSPEPPPDEDSLRAEAAAEQVVAFVRDRTSAADRLTHRVR